MSFNFLKISKFFLYLVPFSVVIVSLGTIFPFIVAKAVFFRAVIDLALIFYVLHWAFGATTPMRNNSDKNVNKLLPLWRQPLVISVMIFTFFYILSGFFGINSDYSFWSNFERGEGGFQILHLFIFFFLLVQIFKEEKEWHRLFITSASAAMLMISYGIGAGLKWANFIGPDFCNRFQGSLGNPAYVGTYLLFSIFYSGYLFIKEQVNIKKWCWGILLVVFAFFLLLTQTRGAFMGAGVGFIFFASYMAFVLPSGWLKKISSGGAILAIIFGGVVILFKPNLNPLPFCSTAGRLLEISISNATFQTRFWTWGSAISGWKDRPLFGWGPENFTEVFDRYFDTRHFNPNAVSETFFDRAHSIYFDYLAQTGILGLLSYLLIFAVFFWQFFKKVNSKKEIGNNNSQKLTLITDYRLSIANALLFALPIAYLVQGLVLFEVLPIYINLFLFLAFANWKLTTKYEKNTNIQNYKNGKGDSQ